jgi:hypothetical protein
MRNFYPGPSTMRSTRFVTAHGAAVRRMFRDVLLIAAQRDLVGAELFALDGCKISSNAAKEHSDSHAELRKKIEKLEHRSRDDKHDDDADQDYPDPPQEIERYQSQIDRTKDFLSDHHPRIGIQGKEVRSNITDNESAKLKSGSGYIQGYNARALVDAKHQIIVHTDLSLSMTARRSLRTHASAPGHAFWRRYMRSTRWCAHVRTGG